MVRATITLLALGCTSLAASIGTGEPPSRLNNFVAELARRENLASGEVISFTLSREGWILVVAKTSTDVQASFRSPEAMRVTNLVFRPGDQLGTVEAMRQLPAGDYQLELRAAEGRALESVAVRSIPEILFNGYCRKSPLPECNAAARDWDFLEKHVNPHINAFVVRRTYKNGQPSGSHPTPEVFEEWLRRGKCWIDEALIDGSAKSVDEACAYYRSNFALSDPGYSGYLIDEFVPREGTQEKHRINVEALTRLAAEAGFAGKKFYPYVVSPATKFPDYADVCRFAVEHHSLLAWEWYIKETKPWENMWDCFRPSYQEEQMRRWAKWHAGADDSLLVTLGGAHLPSVSGDVDPQLNFNVLLDWQFHFLANHPAFAKLRGISAWTSSYMDEETIRWTCRLFRHYCLEGNTERLSTDPFVLDHLVNADFEQETEGWELEPAVDGAIRAGSFPDYGKIQGRYKVAKGDHFLLTRRSSERPNRFGQTVRNLTPGRLYTFRMITADYADLQSGRSKRRTHPLSISLTGAQVLPQGELHLPYACASSKKYAPFDAKQRSCWLEYHWVLFRAESDSAQLNVSDWGDAQQPGGEPGQELIFNFFQVQPYFAAEETAGKVTR